MCSLNYGALDSSCWPKCHRRHRSLNWRRGRDKDLLDDLGFLTLGHHVLGFGQ